MKIERYNPNPNAGINAIANQSNARFRQGGQMYAGGDPNFNERTGQPYNNPGDYYQGQAQYAGQFMPQPRNGDGYLAMLLKKYGGAAQGFGGEIGDWFKNRVPLANRQWNTNWQSRNEQLIKRNGG